MWKWAARVATLGLVWACVMAQDSLTELENRAGQAFDKRDCASALKLYNSALEPARAAGKWEKAALYLRRTGICSYRAGDMDAAFDAYTAGVQSAEKAGSLEMVRENLHGLATALRHLGRHTEALAAAQRALDIAKNCGHPDHMVFELSEVATLYGDIGQMAKSQQLDEQLLEFTRAHHDRGGELTALENLAILYGLLGQPETGVRYVRQALAEVPADDRAGLGRLYANLGALLKGEGRFAEAQAANETALGYLDRPEAWRVRHVLLFNIGTSNVEVKQWTAARRWLEQSLQGLADRDPDIAARAKATLAIVLLHLHEPEEARRTADEAVASARRSEAPAALVQSLTSAGEVYDSIGQTGEAGAFLDEAVTTLEAMRAAAPGDAVALEAMLKEGYSAYQLQVRHSIAATQPESALLWAEKSKARVLNDLLLKGHLDERRAMTDAERQTERTLSAKVSRSAADPKKSRDAIEDLELFRRQLYSRHPELALQRADFVPAGPAEWHKLLPGPNSALLEFFVLRDGLALFVVRENGVTVTQLDIPADALAAETRRFREQLAARDVNYEATARSLYRKLLAPAAAHLAGTTQWILSPDGPLWELPFQALVDARGRHVLETQAISYTPSLTALWAIRQRRANSTPAPIELLAMGNPLNPAMAARLDRVAMSASGTRPGSSKQRSSATSPGALPDAEEEVRAISRLYPPGRTLVLTGADARSDRFREQAPRATVIHIATHADLNTFNPMYSALQLSPGKDGVDAGALTAGDLLRIPLRADIAVLSACETARGKASQGEQLLGMGWALTGAGAAASVISQWKVDSAATAQLMIAFHRNLRKPLAPAEALRRAALEVRGITGNHNPFFWAAFLVLGDGFR